MHQLLALAKQILHFESFLDKKKVSRDTLDTMIQQNEITTIKHDSISKEGLDLFENYQTYAAKTVNGNHGKTAEFWMKYINLIHDYHTLVRSTRTGDFKMFVSILPTITNYFFALTIALVTTESGFVVRSVETGLGR